jgi:methionyl-tRNA formyltransferase
MRLAIIGQQDFGKAVLEAFLARGDEVAGVFCAPLKEGARPDPLMLAAGERGVRVFAFDSLRAPEAHEALRALDVELGVMAYVLQFAPQSLVGIPRHGTIQYHPSLLPRHRGPSSINWPIILGERETGLTIFRPSDGLDEGAVLLQRATPIGPDDTLASVYFDRLFPLGVQSLLAVADEVVAGRARESVQDETQASYEGWVREAESRIDWARHLDQVYNLIRGCNPAPGAWTTLQGAKVKVFDARCHPARRFAEVAGRPGEVVRIGTDGIFVNSPGGQVEILRMSVGGGKKGAAAQVAQAAGIRVGTVLGY